MKMQLGIKLKISELRVGLSADYAPLEFEKTKNGKTEYAGVDIELKSC